MQYNDWAKSWDALAKAIGAAKGQSFGTFGDVEHLTTDQQLKVVEIAALLSISQEVNHLRHALQGEDVGD